MKGMSTKKGSSKGMGSNRKGSVGGTRKGAISSTPFKDNVCRTSGSKR